MVAADKSTAEFPPEYYRDPANIPSDPAVAHQLFPIQQTITTERLVLRPARLSDVEHVRPLLEDPACMRWGSQLAMTNEKESTDWWVSNVLTKYEERIMFVAELRDTVVAGKPVVVGIVGVVNSKPNIGYLVNQNHWRKGYAREMVNGFLKLFWLNNPSAAGRLADDGAGNPDPQPAAIKLGREPWTYIDAHIDHENKPSWSLLHNLGWTRIVEDQEQSFANANFGGAHRRCYVYRINRPE